MWGPARLNSRTITFLIYINDLPNASNILKTLNFADDTTLFLKDKCINNLQITMNQELKKIVQWLTANQLSLNIKKPVPCCSVPKALSQIHSIFV